MQDTGLVTQLKYFIIYIYMFEKGKGEIKLRLDKVHKNMLNNCKINIINQIIEMAIKLQNKVPTFNG